MKLNKERLAKLLKVFKGFVIFESKVNFCQILEKSPYIIEINSSVQALWPAISMAQKAILNVAHIKDPRPVQTDVIRYV